MRRAAPRFASLEARQPLVSGGLRWAGTEHEQSQDSSTAFSIEVPGRGRADMVLVSDGAGGHAGGAEASEAATRAATRVLRQALTSLRPGVSPAAALKHAVVAADAAVRALHDTERFRDVQGKPCATITIALRLGEETVVGWVGDSPAYRYRPSASEGQRVLKLTTPDTLAQRVAEVEQRAGKDPNATANAGLAEGSNILLNSLGNPERALDQERVHVETVDFQQGDMLIVGSDGLGQMRRTAEKRSAQEIEAWLVDGVPAGKAATRKQAAQSQAADSGAQGHALHPDDPTQIAARLVREAYERGRRRNGELAGYSDDVAVEILAFSAPPPDLSSVLSPSSAAGAGRGRGAAKPQGISLGRDSGVFEGFVRFDRPFELHIGDRTVLRVETVRDRPETARLQRDYGFAPSDVIVHSPGHPGIEVLRPGRPLTLGRDTLPPGPLSSLLERDDTVSSVHVGLELGDDGAILVSDLGSTNGTIVRPTGGE